MNRILSLCFYACHRRSLWGQYWLERIGNKYNCHRHNYTKDVEEYFMSLTLWLYDI